jgi:hypothetical protein
MSSADPEERRERFAGHCLKPAEVHVCRRMDIALIAHLGPMARLVVMNESREAKTPEDLFRGPRSGYPDLADAIAENGLHQMFCSR